ncbi:ATP-grasp enzyme [Oscillatoria sp. CS-180]|uniref:ATP-grasp domain-containing protein n=1 Tax=Oscillatoria sp. CS-180 TaxID=3021720 RepID=UPI00232DEC24|nr:ATP-grasp enzyme [Oscillatoria sp. CS-180]MDB9528357.1 ATP-grasp enzyme [Oscillatoria sp. CS-180]
MPSKFNALIKTTAALVLLMLALPFNLLVVSTAYLWSWVRGSSPPIHPTGQPQRILITGGKMTKALQLARSFHQAGHSVVLIETHKYWLSGHRFSRAVDRFYTVPIPEHDPSGYVEALLNLVQQEKIDAFIPVSSPIASYYDAIAGERLAPYCQVIHGSPTVIETLDNKYELCRKASALGLTTPKAFLITHPQQILEFDFQADGSRYLLKSIRYDSVSRLDMTRLPCPDMESYVSRLPISETNPWVMQEFIRGQEYCTHSTVRDGKIRLHCCSRSSPFQVNYAHIHNPAIDAWVETFVGALGLTGQISFDFIQAPNGTVYPIECNPRTHSAITMFYNHSQLAEAYLEDAETQSSIPITPLPSSRPTYWFYHEAWRLTAIKSWSDVKTRLTTLWHGTDALLQIDDPLPFFTVPHWQVTLLLLNNLRQLKDWVKIDFNIGKLVERGGD